MAKRLISWMELLHPERTLWFVELSAEEIKGPRQTGVLHLGVVGLSVLGGRGVVVSGRGLLVYPVERLHGCRRRGQHLLHGALIREPYASRGCILLGQTLVSAGRDRDLLARARIDEHDLVVHEIG